MNTCEKCQRPFPSYLVRSRPAFQDPRKTCPICKLEEENKVHNLRRDNFQDGTLSQKMLEEARAYLDVRIENKILDSRFTYGC